MFWRIFRNCFARAADGLRRSDRFFEWGPRFPRRSEYHLDAEQKLTHEFRTLGANVVVAPPSSGSEPRWRMPRLWTALLDQALRRLSPRRRIFMSPQMRARNQSSSRARGFDQVAK